MARELTSCGMDSAFPRGTHGLGWGGGCVALLAPRFLGSPALAAVMGSGSPGAAAALAVAEGASSCARISIESPVAWGRGRGETFQKRRKPNCLGRCDEPGGDCQKIHLVSL